MEIYLKYSVLTNIDVKNNFNAEFPTLTICNLNRVLVFNYEFVMNQIPYEPISQNSGSRGGGPLNYY